jgi:hypothetical protein
MNDIVTAETTHFKPGSMSEQSFFVSFLKKFDSG